ncbi:uncharacterized protein LOC134277851 [Saccostrea cucullata]|uniref:uncharacterized protein LOC134277851 n=1 Tax=Saccostrea cuccullata TaxID=36930 RepID=UPI002ED19079
MGNEGIYVVGKIENHPISMLVDTGASVTILSSKVFENLDLKKGINLTPSLVKLTSANGERILVRGECPMKITVGDKTVTHNFLVANILNKCILGIDFMQQNACDILVKKMKFKIKGVEVPCVNSENLDIPFCKVLLAEDIEVPLNSEFIAPGKIENPLFTSRGARVEPTEKFVEKHELLIPKTLVKVEGEVVPIRYINCNDHSVKIHKGTVLATIENVEDMSENTETVNTLCNDNNNSESDLPKHFETIIQKLPEN